MIFKEFNKLEFIDSLFKNANKICKKNKINIITLGCSKNIYDSEVLMSQLSANKIDVEHESGFSRCKYCCC